jgi:hypothetical protein
VNVVGRRDNKGDTRVPADNGDLSLKDEDVRDNETYRRKLKFTNQTLMMMDAFLGPRDKGTHYLIFFQPCLSSSHDSSGLNSWSCPS